MANRKWETPEDQQDIKIAAGLGAGCWLSIFILVTVPGLLLIGSCVAAAW